jgi:ribose 5-phosphate isomerase A
MEFNAKQVAAEAAVSFVKSGMVVGLGSGSTAEYAIRKIGSLVRLDDLQITGIPTSLRTERLAFAEKIPLSTPARHSVIDVTIDGADEIDPEFNMIKGGGGAHFREKIIASMTRKEIIVVDESKCVEVLGVRFPVPVEVVPFAAATVSRKLEAMGAQVTVRPEKKAARAADEPSFFFTDNGNVVLDCKFPRIADPKALEKEINSIRGVVENGLFVGLAHLLCIGTKSSPKAILQEKPPR